MHELRVQILGTAQVFGALFAARLCWSLRSIFIAVELPRECLQPDQGRREQGGLRRFPLAEWKAGFIEDAQDLHLALKPLFASVIRAWGSEAEVKGSLRDVRSGWSASIGEADVPCGARVGEGWERLG
jgi:hypothetical protein